MVTQLVSPLAVTLSDPISMAPTVQSCEVKWVPRSMDLLFTCKNDLKLHRIRNNAFNAYINRDELIGPRYLN